MEINIAPELKTKIETIASELNTFINSGKWEVFNDEAQALIDKWGLNDLLFIGCKHHQLPATFYLELPYKELEEKDINAVLVRLSKLQVQ